MYEFTTERQLIPYPMLTGEHDELDYDYDVYLFYPSRPDFLVEPWDSDDDALEISSQTDNQFHNAVPLPPLSPTYSIASDFVFPDVDGSGHHGMEALGYTKMFVCGLVSAQIARRLDDVLNKIRKILRMSRAPSN